MSTEENTSKALRFSIIISIIVVTIGAIVNIMNQSTDVLWFGILLLIISPLIGVVITTISLIVEKDWKWVYVAFTLIVVSVIGMIL